MDPATIVNHGGATGSALFNFDLISGLRDFVGALGSGSVPITERLEQGEPQERIVTLARDEGFDLIVMGTLGRTGRPLTLVGSVADSVVRTSPRPVLTVREVAKAAP